MTMEISSPLKVILALGFSLALISCRVTSNTVARSQQANESERLEVIYQAHPANGPLFITPSSSKALEVVQASARSSADEAEFLSWSKAELRIEFPHPAGHADVARVTLHLRPVDCGQECRRSTWGEKMEVRSEQRQNRRATFRERLLYESSSDSMREAPFFELDLPKSEVDAILTELNTHGFFVEQVRPEPESHLEVRVNRRWTSRSWGYEPTLDALITRVYEEGTRQNEDSQF
jgi:hypothetical protein